MFGTFQDVTEQKRAEESLRESEERYRSIFEQAADSILIVDSNGSIIEFNDRAHENLGYTRQEFEKLKIADFEIIEFDEEVRKHIDKVRKEGADEFETKHVTKDGEKRDILVNSKPISIGGKVYLQSIWTDITERKKAEDALAEQASFMINNPAPVLRIGLDGTVLFSNPAAKELFKRTIVGATVQELIPAFARFLKQIENETYPIQVENAIFGESYLFTARHDQSARSIFIYGSNITERKRAEAELKRYSERLEEMVDERTQELRETQEKLLRRERLAVLGQLAGGVGHELRNPLGVITNAVYCLKTVHEGADEKTQEYLEMISSEVRNVEKIVSDLLDLSRTRPTEAERTAVSDLISGALERASVSDNIEVEVGVPEGLPEVFIDRQQIKQVLLNLITNACQAMAEGGGLSVRARAVGERVEVAVSDTGCGISVENMEKIFEPLFTTKARGIGLGLAVSKNLLEVGGGSIEVESEEGKGSTFTVILPTSL